MPLLEWLEVGRLDNWSPVFRFGLHHCCQFGRRRRRGTIPDLAKASTTSGSINALRIASDARATTGAGTPAGMKMPNHSVTTISFTPCSESRHVWIELRAFRAAGRQYPSTIVLGVGEERAIGQHQGCHLSRHHVGKRRRATSIGNGLDQRTERAGQQEGEEVRQRSLAGIAAIRLAGIGFRPLTKLCERLNLRRHPQSESAPPTTPLLPSGPSRRQLIIYCIGAPPRGSPSLGSSLVRVSIR